MTFCVLMLFSFSCSHTLSKLDKIPGIGEVASSSFKRSSQQNDLIASTVRFRSIDGLLVLHRRSISFLICLPSCRKMHSLMWRWFITCFAIDLLFRRPTLLAIFFIDGVIYCTVCLEPGGRFTTTYERHIL